LRSEPAELWRVFPWREGATPGDPFSPSYVPPPTGRGRFDIPRNRSFVLYLAESPDHAVGEALQPWRGRPLSEALLKQGGLPLSLVRVRLDDVGSHEVADLCDPELLARLGVAPDRLASRLRWVTQPLAASLWQRDFGGLRWWSSFWGEWHTVVLFLERVRDRLTFGEPEPLTIESAPVLEAARLMGMEV
jgi:hypothetical protein